MNETRVLSTEGMKPIWENRRNSE